MDVPVPALTGTGSSPAAGRVFDLEQPGGRPGTLARGILLMRAWPPPALRLAGAGQAVVTVEGRHHLVHVPLPDGMLASAGLDVVRRSRPAGAALHPGGDAGAARLALAFAVHLGDRRRHDAYPVRPCVTSATAPDLASAPDLVRLPHLLTVRGHMGSLADAVVWEVMTSTQSRRWLGGPLPDQSFYEKHLPVLLQLRYLARTGQLPASDAGERLRELTAGRCLSIRMVYCHPALFAALIRASTAGR